ncbi:MAG TPA: hypothetical protein VEC08_00820, partial [Nitrososphaerales archaeon]|nr:hypothetical protein [Nitrososphaerales archaeon]
GDGDRAKQVVEALKANPLLTWENATRFVAINIALGDLDRAFEELMTQSENKGWSTLMKSHPFYANVRKDPRFVEFCERVGIPAGN